MKDWNKTAKNIQIQIDALRAEISKKRNLLDQLQRTLNETTGEKERKKILSEIAFQENQISAIESQIVGLERDLQDAIDNAKSQADWDAKVQEGGGVIETKIVPSYVDVPDPSSGYDAVKAAMRANIERQIAAIQGSGPGVLGGLKPQNANRAKQNGKLLLSLVNKLNNWDSYFDNMWKTEIAPQIKSKQPAPSYPGVPQGAMPSLAGAGMAPEEIQRQALMLPQSDRYRPQTEGMAQRPITWEERQRLMGIKPAQASTSATKKPPMSSLPQQPSSYSGSKPVDENEIPMVQTSAGWVRDRRFYKPDGTLFGTM